jgi:energy-coupling factor transporter ATP-binding protein EcfA2
LPFTALEYVAWSARLVGHSRGDARAQAEHAIERMKLTSTAKTPLARLAPQVRRGVVVAAAVATGARAIALEDPLGGLPEEVARAWARMLVASLEDLSWVVFAPRVPLTSPLALHAEEAVVVSGARLDAQGQPAEIAALERRFVAHVHGPVEALGPRLSERGARLEGHAAGGSRIVVDLGASLTTSELLGVLRDAGVVVVELYPVSRALT